MSRVQAHKLKEADFKRQVGQNLALAREALNLRQADLARAYPSFLGPRQQNKLSQWEDGTHFPPPFFLRQLCEDYGFTMDFFYRGLRAGVSASLVDDLRRVEAEKSEA